MNKEQANEIHEWFKNKTNAHSCPTNINQHDWIVAVDMEQSVEYNPYADKVFIQDSETFQMIKQEIELGCDEIQLFDSIEHRKATDPIYIKYMEDKEIEANEPIPF